MTGLKQLVMLDVHWQVSVVSILRHSKAGSDK
jgi:hypothetical protein